MTKFAGTDLGVSPGGRVRDHLVAGQAEKPERLHFARYCIMQRVHMISFVFAGPELCVAEGATPALLLVLRLSTLLREGLSLRLQQKLHDLAHRHWQGAAVVGQGEVAQEGGDVRGVAVFLVDHHLPFWERLGELARLALALG